MIGQREMAAHYLTVRLKMHFRGYGRVRRLRLADL